MLVLSRKAGESIRLGPDIYVSVESVRGSRVRLGIEAPDAVQIVRTELLAAGATSADRPARAEPHGDDDRQGDQKQPEAGMDVGREVSESLPHEGPG